MLQMWRNGPRMGEDAEMGIQEVAYSNALASIHYIFKYNSAERIYSI